MALLLDSLRSAFDVNVPHQQEDRTLLFSVPVNDGGSIGLLAPLTSFWVQLSLVLTFLACINTIAAIFVYYFVVKKRGTMGAFLVGYGAICPILLALPFQMVPWLGLWNTSHICGISASLTIVIFRCMMAMHGTNPTFIEQDAITFVKFYVAPISFNFDSKTGSLVPSSRKDLREKAWELQYTLLVLACTLGWTMHYNYELVPKRDIGSLWDLCFWGNILNNYILAYLMGTCLAAGTQAVGLLLECLTGKSVIRVSDSPMTASTSPSDFWGRRWNGLVHNVLKGAVYVPMRQNSFPKAWAGIATFAASGVMHEYVMLAMSMKFGQLPDHHPSYTPKYGYHLLFFLWNGFVLGMEGFAARHSAVKWMEQNLPTPVITALVLLTVLPIAHWFTDEYVEFGFFEDLALGFPTLVWRANQS